jgi:hypothetical protein
VSISPCRELGGDQWGNFSTLRHGGGTLVSAKNAGYLGSNGIAGLRREKRHFADLGGEDRWVGRRSGTETKKLMLVKTMATVGPAARKLHIVMAIHTTIPCHISDCNS